MGYVTPTNGPLSEIQHGGCVVDSLEKVKHIAKTKYIETVNVLYCVVFFESALTHEHCAEAHTHNTAYSPKDTGLLGTRITL